VGGIALSERLQPKLAVVMETELWPNHIHQCARRGIPVALANARLSERSARGYARFARLTAPMLAELSLIAAQTEAEAVRFRQLGARETSVQVTGSIKFDLSIDPALLERAAQLRTQWGACIPADLDWCQHARGGGRDSAGCPSPTVSRAP
jgi:3-deoxy-D-manno-octulosonic-acid transferase